MTSWRVPLRIARRVSRRSRGRSILVVLLIALPVFAAVLVAVTIRTYQLSPEQDATRLLGHADGIAMDMGTASVSSDMQISRDRDSGPYMTTTLTNAPAASQERKGYVDLPGLLPAGVRAIPDAWSRGATAVAGDKRAEVQELLLDLNDPMTRGIMQHVSGRYPQRAGEVAITTYLARRLNIHVGSTVSLPGLGPVRVTATLRDPFSLDDAAVVAGEATFGTRGVYATSTGSELRWLVGIDRGAGAGLHDALARHGVVFTTRHDWTHPSPGRLLPSHSDPQTYAVLGVIVVFGLLEVVLLAGAAFAVGVRRQIHDLGLLRVGGGDEKDVARTILAQGVVLGLVGALTGTVLGIAAVFFGRPLLERAGDRAFGPLDARPLELVAIIALGVVAAVVAAVAPARSTKRLAVIPMLKASFPYDARNVRMPRWAAAVTPLGVLLTVAAAWQWHRSQLRYEHALAAFEKAAALSSGVGGQPVPPSDRRWAALLAIGAALTLAGLVRACPPLLARMSRWGDRLPLAMRLAVRDSARHRHRAAPAVAAVMTVLTGAVLVVFVMSSTDLRAKQRYTNQIPLGDVTVSVPSGPDGGPPAMGPLKAAVETAARGLPTRFGAAWGVVNIPSANGDPGANGYVMPHLPADFPCDDGTVRQSSACQITSSQVAAGGPEVVDAIAGRHIPAAAAALAAGHAVVFRTELARNGRVVLDVQAPAVNGTSQTTTMSLPAYVVPLKSYGELPQVLISDSLAAARHWSVSPTIGFIATTRPPTQQEEDRSNKLLGADGGLYVERGYHAHYGIALLILAAAAGLVTIAGSCISVALSSAESVGDLATLAAVGASPGRRRVQAIAQSATVSALGAALGVGLGCLIAISLLVGSSSYPMTVPIRWLVIVGVSAPIVATLAGALFAGSKQRLTRRIA